MFEEMIAAIQDETVRRLYSVRLKKNEEVKRERVAKATGESVGGDGTVKKQPREGARRSAATTPAPAAPARSIRTAAAETRNGGFAHVLSGP